MRLVSSVLVLMWASAAVAEGAAPPPAPAPRVSAAKTSDPGLLGGRWYATAELRHHLNTFYDEQGRYNHQEPSMHARLQVGSQFYDGLIDAYATLGIFKEPHTQQVMQRRPELAVDLYPVKSDYFTLLQYNLVQLPVRSDTSGQTPEDEKEDYSESTVYMLGLAPLAKWPMMLGGSKLELKGGLDAWTKLYSRRQYTGIAPRDDDDETDGHLALSATDGSETQSGEPIEDYALHYQGQGLAGVAFSPSFLRSLTTEASVHYHSRFDPRYARHEDGGVDYAYGVERYSYYQIRLHYDLTDRLALTNDFYHFHEGFFTGERKGDERRYRNIARISCRM